MNDQWLIFLRRFYNPERREFLGRDGLRWGKLGLFYFGFYFGLGSFCCLMMAVFFAVTPRDHPRYFGEASSMTSRSEPLSPGLGFRPHRDIETNTIYINRTSGTLETNPDLISLKDFFEQTYPSGSDSPNETFVINDPGLCTPQNDFGFFRGQPCVLVKMNKIFGFEPLPGYRTEDEIAFREAGCRTNPQSIQMHCYGEYPADVDAVGNITYISENSLDNHCGELETKWFPFPYPRSQTPFIWVQFNNPKPNMLIDVVCRLFASNVHFNKIRSQGSTRFQLYIHETVL